MNYFRFRISR